MKTGSLHLCRPAQASLGSTRRWSQRATTGPGRRAIAPPWLVGIYYVGAREGFQVLVPHEPAQIHHVDSPSFDGARLVSRCPSVCLASPHVCIRFRTRIRPPHKRSKVQSSSSEAIPQNASPLPCKRLRARGDLNFSTCQRDLVLQYRVAYR